MGRQPSEDLFEGAHTRATTAHLQTRPMPLNTNSLPTAKMLQKRGPNHRKRPNRLDSNAHSSAASLRQSSQAIEMHPSYATFKPNPPCPSTIIPQQASHHPSTPRLLRHHNIQTLTVSLSASSSAPQPRT